MIFSRLRRLQKEQREVGQSKTNAIHQLEYTFAGIYASVKQKLIFFLLQHLYRVVAVQSMWMVVPRFF